ncbi:MAG: hypothetical protein HN763_03920, partial [Opitutales bacterium]|nr:hypothetical protein [Opitutales bacterium]
MTKNRSSLSFAVLLAALIVLFSGLGFAQSDSNALAPLVVNAGSSEDEVKSEEDASGDGSPESSTDEKTVSADEEEDPVEKARTAELKRLKDEREMIQARLSLRSEQFKEELIGLKEEKERLSTENSLVRERLSDELTELKLANERLNAQIDT